MHILQVMAGARHGGAESFFERLVVGLQENGLRQTVLTRPHAERLARLQLAGIPLHSLRFGGRLDILSPWRVRQHIQGDKPDIVMAWMNRAAASLPARCLPVKVGRLGGYYDLKYYRHCDYVVGNTPDICRYLQEQGVPANKQCYIPNFVDETPGVPMVRAIWDTPEGVPLCVALARYHPNKALDTLLYALAKTPDAWLWIAGEGPLESSLKQLAQSLGITSRVRFLPWQPTARDIIATADAVICPSRHEPLGNVVLESWAQSKPIIAAASQGPAQLIRTGENGLLCSVDDAGALAAAMREVIDTAGLALSLAKAGYQHYHQHFSRARIVQQYRDFFRSIV